MEIDSELVLQFVHDVAKPLKTMLARMELVDLMPTDPKETVATLLSYRESLASAKQALEDLQCFSTCQALEKDSWENFEWSPLMSEHLRAMSKATPAGFESEVVVDSLKGYGARSLIWYALQNMGWFVTHYQNRLIRFSAKRPDHSETVCLGYQFAAKEELRPEFVRMTPFCPMSRESLTITHNTGLVLSMVKRIVELHGGLIKTTVDKNNAHIELSLPLASAEKGS